MLRRNEDPVIVVTGNEKLKGSYGLMLISFVEIQNFRRLKSIRIDFSDAETLFVGANNSGKTSAMEALSHFLLDQRFSTKEFTLSNWQHINKIGAEWRECR